MIYRATNKRTLTLDEYFFCNLTVDVHVFRFLASIHLEREAYLFCNVKEISRNVFEAKHFTIDFNTKTLPIIKFKDPDVVLIGYKFFSIHERDHIGNPQFCEEFAEGFQTRLFFDVDHPDVEIQKVIEAIEEVIGDEEEGFRITVLKNNLFSKYHLITNLVVTFDIAKSITQNVNTILGYKACDMALHSGNKRSLRAPYCQKFQSPIEVSGFYSPTSQEHQREVHLVNPRDCYITPHPNDIVLQEGIDSVQFPQIKILNKEKFVVETWCKNKIIMTKPIDHSNFVYIDGVMTNLVTVETNMIPVEVKGKYGLFAIFKKYTGGEAHFRNFVVLPNIKEGLCPQGDLGVMMDVTGMGILNRSEHPEGIWFKINTSISDTKEVYIDGWNKLYCI